MLILNISITMAYTLCLRMIKKNLIKENLAFGIDEKKYQKPK